METPQEHKSIPATLLVKGPDAIRGSGYAFIYTKYPDPEGNRWFIQPGYIGHESMTNTKEMLIAMFGGEAPEVAAEVITVRDVYDGPKASGKTREEYDYVEIRRLAKRENIFGRCGELGGRNVVMLWGAPENWQAMLVDVLRLLKSTPDTVVTVGSTNQFLAGDFLSQSDEPREAHGTANADQTANEERLEPTPSRQQLLLDALLRVMKMQIDFAPEFSLKVVEDHYRPDPTNPRCHPLESVLLGEPRRGDTATQIGEMLGEDQDWIVGFCDHYKGLEPRKTIEQAEAYLRGFHDAGDEQIIKLTRTR
jgi:hypothetical protein